MKNLLIALACTWLPALTMAQEWHSGPSRVDLVELFTSEGCSSCPPADRWLSALKDDPALFSDFVPMAFHVDYWDYIGWKDPFAKPEFSGRQRQYVREGHVSQPYTPGIVINSKEWRDWFRGKQRWSRSDQRVGNLHVEMLENRALQVAFDGRGAQRLHIALLGMNLTTAVRAGENRGRQLTHDFVVLYLVSVKGAGPWQVDLPAAPEAGQNRTAIAAWVTPADSMAVIQATGGYLD